MKTPTLDELSKRYSEMLPEDFNSLNPNDLTEEARTIYFQEKTRRNNTEWKAEETIIDNDIKQESKESKYIILPKNQLWTMVMISIIEGIIIHKGILGKPPAAALGSALGQTIGMIAIAWIVSILPAGIYWLFEKKRMPGQNLLIWIVWAALQVLFGIVVINAVTVRF